MQNAQSANEIVMPNEIVPSANEMVVPNEMVPSANEIVMPNEIAPAEIAPSCAMQIETIQQSLTKFKTSITDLQVQLRTLEKSITKETKKPVSKPMRQPKIIGFDILEKITPELGAFMKLPPETLTTRNAATLYLTEYIRIHQLQDLTNRRMIHLNPELAALFKLTTSLTYFNLHKHISAHFIRT
jgi:chromatin remodeling complex protein RSC6